MLVALFYRDPPSRSVTPGTASIRFGDVVVFLRRPSVAADALVVAVTLPRLRPLVQREPVPERAA